MDVSTDEYHTANDESFTNTGYTVTPSKNVQTTTLAARKQLTPTATDANEPAKPLSAYGLFFRDTVSAIKQQNPNCTFQELSRIVSSMWEALDASHKKVYSNKHEAALTEYMKQLRIYKQQQEEKQQQQQQQQQQEILITNSNDNAASAALQTRPAVFTISRYNADGSNTTNQNISTNSNEVVVNTTKPPNQAASTVSAPSTNSATSNDPAQPQIQILSDANAVQKCTRENCNKRAIINPDWEDEYCSNECVVIHCRNVFNAWVQTNLDARRQ